MIKREEIREQLLYSSRVSSSDTSRTYIEMCGKADKELSEHLYRLWDWIEVRDTEEPHCSHLVSPSRMFAYFDKRYKTLIYNRQNLSSMKAYVWLPTLSELQETADIRHMLDKTDGAEYSDTANRNYARQVIADYTDNHAENLPEHLTFVYDGLYWFNTYEKQWLCYIMENLYNKTWNGKEWELKK